MPMRFMIRLADLRAALGIGRLEEQYSQWAVTEIDLQE
jgi:hypothetical protein